MGFLSNKIWVRIFLGHPVLAKEMVSWGSGGCTIYETCYKESFCNSLVSFWCWCLTFVVEAWKISCWNDWAQWHHCLSHVYAKRTASIQFLILRLIIWCTLWFEKCSTYGKYLQNDFLPMKEFSSKNLCTELPFCGSTM